MTRIAVLSLAGLTFSIALLMSITVTRSKEPAPRPGNPAALQTFYPVPRPGIIKNPGVGYETFYRSAAADRQLPSSTMYIRLNWSAIESAPGAFNFGPIDKALAQAQANGQRLAFRIMAYAEGNGGPVGLRRAGFPGFAFVFSGTDTWVPNLDDSGVQQDLQELIAALGRRYGDNPAIDSVDLGLIGDWGEQHFWNTNPKPPYPSTATLRWLSDQFKANFRVPLVVNDGIWESDPDAFGYAIRSKIGWRVDCWGGQREMTFKYPRIVEDVPNAWQNAPVILEPCGVMADWVAHRFQWRESLQWAIDKHVSEISNKSSPIPAEMLAEVRNMLIRLGYRFALKQATFPVVMQAGTALPLQLVWENQGNAPMYFERHVLVGIGPGVVDTGVSMRGFSPGMRTDVAMIDTGNLRPGKYEIKVGLGPPESRAPDIALAIEGQGPWYPLGSVTLSQ
jgi:hypothetical protein